MSADSPGGTAHNPAPRKRAEPERVAMKITSHKTRSVFDRCHIVGPADLQEAAWKLAGTVPDTQERARLQC